MVAVTETPLTLSTSLARPRSVMLVLVSGGAILDYRNGRSLTAVHVAVLRGNRDALTVRTTTHHRHRHHRHLRIYAEPVHRVK